MLELLGLVLAGIHFGVPVGYYFYVKRNWLPKPWDIVDKDHMTKVTIIIPTYNEAATIKEKLDNLYCQNYPRGLQEIVVVDSASQDATVEIVQEWSREHSDIVVRQISDLQRRGMVPALNFALRSHETSGEIVVFTDADAYCGPFALRNVVRCFADPRIGAVSASVLPMDHANESTESYYRGYYNTVRVAESKVHSTPIQTGSFMGFRRELLHRIGGLPAYTGNNDCTPASVLAFLGYRAIQLENEVVKEIIKKDQHLRKVRRAQHLLLSFLKTKKYAKEKELYTKSVFDRIWRVEWYLHVVNPWLLPLGAFLLLANTMALVFTSLVPLVIGLFLLGSRTFRMWILQQVYLMTALVRNLWTKDIAWKQ